MSFFLCRIIKILIIIIAAAWLQKSTQTCWLILSTSPFLLSISWAFAFPIAKNSHLKTKARIRFIFLWALFFSSPPNNNSGLHLRSCSHPRISRRKGRRTERIIREQNGFCPGWNSTLYAAVKRGTNLPRLPPWKISSPIFLMGGGSLILPGLLSILPAYPQPWESLLACFIYLRYFYTTLF